MSTYAEMQDRLRRQQEAERLRQEQDPVAPSPQPKSEVEKTFGGFMRNLGADAKAMFSGAMMPFTDYNEFDRGLQNFIFNDEGERSLDGAKEAGKQIVQRYKDIAKNPWDEYYEAPLSTGMDVAAIAMPTRAASRMMPDGSVPQRVADTAANVIQNVDPTAAIATAGVALNAAVTDPVKLTEGVVKPKTGSTQLESNPTYREEVITTALDRNITPDAAGMKNLDRQLQSQFEQIDQVLANTNVRVPMGHVVTGFEDWAKSQVKETHANRKAILDGIERQSNKIKDQYSLDEHGDPIDYRDGRYLREARISADGEVNHNRVSQQNDSVKVEVDKLYANYLRERLGYYVPEIRAINAEASTLLSIQDMYTPAFNRLSNNNPIPLSATIGAAGSGAGIAAAGAANGLTWPAVVGTAMSAIPPMINAASTRTSRAGSAYNARKSGGGNNPLSGAAGATVRDRGTELPFYMRQGFSFTDALSSELMRQEEE